MIVKIKFKSFIFIVLVALQVAAIYTLTKGVIKLKKKVLGQVSVNPISKEDLITTPTGNLKYFYEPSPSSSVKSTLNDAIYTINSDALNERFDYEVEKPEGVFRIITLGDSFTFGEHVNTEENWPETLEDMLNKNLTCSNINQFEVINLGAPGYDFEYAVERYRIKGKKYNPDLIVWFLLDFDRIREMIAPIAQKLGDTQPIENFRYEHWRIATNQVVEELGEEGVLMYQTEAISKIKDHYQGGILFLTLPDSPKYNYLVSKKEKQMIGDFVRSRKLTWYSNDLPDIFSIPGAKLENDGHPSPYGHQLISEKVYQIIEAQSLIPCN